MGKNQDYNQDNNQKPLVDNENITTENSEDGYTFVEERIVSKSHRVRKVLTKIFVDLLVPVCVCLLVCYVYFTTIGKDDDDNDKEPEETTTENSIIVNGDVDDKNEQPSEGTTGKDNLEQEENLIQLEESIKKMVVVVSVVRQSEEVTSENSSEEITAEGETSSQSETTTEGETSSQTETTTEGETTDQTETTTVNENQSTNTESTLEDQTVASENQPVEVAEVTEKHTGVIVSMHGPIYILIPYENIEGYKELYAHIGGEVTLATTVYDIDYATGLALLKIEAAKITSQIRGMMSVATFEGKNQVNDGSSIVYCGNVVGNTPMFIKGHISNSSNHVTCTDMNYNMLITDITLDSVQDGFLFNSRGNLVGIAGLSSGDIELPNVVAGANALDLEYIINNMLNDKKDIYFGITGQAVSPEIEEIAGGNMPDGIYVSSVIIDSPAYNAGVMTGDIIITIGGVNEPDMAEFRESIEGRTKGDTIQIRVKRKIGNTYNVYSIPVVLDSRD